MPRWVDRGEAERMMAEAGALRRWVDMDMDDAAVDRVLAYMDEGMSLPAAILRFVEEEEADGRP